jgi:hypothetical protein
VKACERLLEMEAVLPVVDDLIIHVLDLVNHPDHASNDAVVFHVGTHTTDNNTKLVKVTKVTRMKQTPSMTRTANALASHFEQKYPDRDNSDLMFVPMVWSSSVKDPVSITACARMISRAKVDAARKSIQTGVVEDPKVTKLASLIRCVGFLPAYLIVPN